MSGPPHLFEVTVLAEWTDYHVRGVIDTAELRVQHYRALVRHIQDENLQSGYSFWIEGHFGHLVVDDETLHATVDDAKLAAVEALGRQMRQDSHQHRMKYIEEVSKAAGMPPPGLTSGFLRQADLPAPVLLVPPAPRRLQDQPLRGTEGRGPVIYAAAWVIALGYVGNLIGTNLARLAFHLLDKTRPTTDQGETP